MVETLHSKLESEGFLVQGIYPPESFSEVLASFAVENSREEYSEVYICDLERALAGEYSPEGRFQIIYYKPSEKKNCSIQKNPHIILKRNSDEHLCRPLNISGRLQFI